MQKSFNATHFRDMQYSMDKTGNEKIIHSTNATLQLNPDKCVFALDGDNAFMREERSMTLKEVKAHFPESLPYMNMLYGSDSRAWFHGKAEGIDHINSQKGLHQGCTSGTWGYDMGTLPMIRELQEVIVRLDTEGFAKFSTDDGTLAGSFESLYAGLEYLFSEGPAYGYYLKLSKGKFLLGKCDSDQVAQDQKQRLVQLGIQENNICIHPDNVQAEDKERAVANYGVKLLGTWLGTDEYVGINLQNKLETLRAEAGKLKNVSDTQTMYLLLSNCYCQKVNHLMRTTPNRLL
jgi:hypothetical protein